MNKPITGKVKEKIAEVKPMTIGQIKACKDNDLLRKHREWLMENVSKIVKSDKNPEGTLDFKEWDLRICHIDLKVDGVPLKVYLTNVDGKGFGVTGY